MELEHHRERLVHVVTEDGFTLSGAIYTPTAPIGPMATIVWTHGFTVSYDIQQWVTLGREVAARGHRFLAGQNRGHDLGSRLWPTATGKASTIGGGWWERFDEAPRDVAAWIELARHDLGVGPLALFGHSFGTHRVLRYLADIGDGQVDGVGLVSGNVRRHESVRSDVLALASQMVAQGRGEELLPPGSYADFVGNNTVSAQTYVSWGGQALDLFGLRTPGVLAQIRRPIFACFGTNGDIGNEKDLALIREKASSSAAVHTTLIAGADHGFLGKERPLAEAIVEWVGSL